MLRARGILILLELVGSHGLSSRDPFMYVACQTIDLGLKKRRDYSEKVEFKNHNSAVIRAFPTEVWIVVLGSTDFCG